MQEKAGRRGVLFYIGFVLAAFFLLVCLWQMSRVNSLSRNVKNFYASAYAGLSDSVHKMDAILKKAAISQNRDLQAELFLNLCTETGVAETCLSFLLQENETVLKTREFLSQVSAFVSEMSAKELTIAFDKDDTEKLEEFTKTATALCENFFKTDKESPVLSAEAVLKAKTGGQPPLLLADKPHFTRDEARQVAEVFLENERALYLAPNGENNGVIPTYEFVAQPEKNRTVTLSVTRPGGYVLFLHDDRRVKEQNLDIQSAVLTSKRFLARQGLYHMRPCYYEVEDNVATITILAEQQETVLLQDIIKVKIALDNGEVVGFDAKEYIMNHYTRQMPASILSLKKAQTFLNPNISVVSAVLSLVPSGDEEVLCYAFYGNYQNEQFLIYINAETGEEETVLLLQKRENGGFLF